MSLELTNLLPAERVRALRRLYFVRLATVAVALLVGVAIIHSVLLLPSYLYLKQQTKERQAQLAELSERLAGSEEREVSARVTALSEDAAYLSRLADASTASAAVSALTNVPRAGIRLTGFTFTPGKDGADTKMTLAGIASTREALRAYEQALTAQTYVASAELPISAYAKETDISFTITLTGPLSP